MVLARVLALVFGAAVMSIVNTSMVNVALPQIMAEFGVDFERSILLYSGYLLPYAVGQPIGGSLGDIFGARRVFMLGVAVFALGALLCTLADSFWLLLAARTVQAAGAAAIMPNSMVLATAPFGAGARGEIIGWWGTVSSVGSLVGPALGGFLTEHAGWHSVFFVNLPVAAAVLLLGRQVIPPVAAATGKPGRFDHAGATLLTAGLASLLAALMLVRTRGLWHEQVMGWTLFFAAALAVFLWWEGRAPQPLISLALIGRKAVAAVMTVGFFHSVALFGILLLIPLYLQHARGYTPSAAGLMLLPLSLTMMAVSPAAGRIAGKRGGRLLIPGGMAATVAGVLLFARLAEGGGAALLATAMVVTGTGLALAGTPLATVLMGLVEQGQMGVASGVFNMVRLVGGVIGSTLLGVFLQHRVDGGATLAAAFGDVYTLAAAGTAAGLAAAVWAALFVKRQAR